LLGGNVVQFVSREGAKGNKIIRGNKLNGDVEQLVKAVIETGLKLHIDMGSGLMESVYETGFDLSSIGKPANWLANELRCRSIC
jgi:hypothetical protein